MALNAEALRRLTCPLEYLCWDSYVDDEMMEKLCEIKTLTTLIFPGPAGIVSLAGWAHVTKLPLLRHLEIHELRLTKECIRLFCSIRSLRVMDFSDSLTVEFLDEWFEWIALMPHLEFLACNCDEITGCGFHHLYQMKSLRKIDLRSLTLSCQIEKVVELQKRMPSLAIQLSRLNRIDVNKYIADEEEKAGTRRERE
jgi:hypothetical protein